MKIVSKTVLPVLLAAMGLACGYSKPKTTTPAISQLSPGATTAGSAGFQLEVEGTNFASNAKVNFGGVPEVTTFVNATKLEANIPATAVAASGSVPVTVSNPDSTGLYGSMGAVTSAPMPFMIN